MIVKLNLTEIGKIIKFQNCEKKFSMKKIQKQISSRENDKNSLIFYSRFKNSR